MMKPLATTEAARVRRSQCQTYSPSCSGDLCKPKRGFQLPHCDAILTPTGGRAQQGGGTALNLKPCCVPQEGSVNQTPLLSKATAMSLGLLSASPCQLSSSRSALPVSTSSVYSAPPVLLPPSEQTQQRPNQ